MTTMRVTKAAVGVAVMQDGSLLMSDDGTGTVWRIAYSGGAADAAH